MWVLLLVMLASGRPGRAMCPARCLCNDDALEVSCASAALQVVPIQLNPEVRKIDLSGNRISHVHFTFAFYSNLLSLDLSSNRIETLGSGNFESQGHLGHFNLSDNQLHKLSKDSFKGLYALTALDLSSNLLEEISLHTFRDLHSLRVLRLTNNALVYLEDGLFKPTTLLTELYLENNQLLEVTAVSDVPSLIRLSLSKNFIMSIDEMPLFPELQILLLDNNVVNDINAAALSGLLSLEYLDLSDNNFTTVPTVPLAKLSNLTKLKFSGNLINTVPPVAFRGLFQLRILRLDRLEFLTRIDSRAFVDNINLEKIWLDDNIGVQTLPHRLFHGNPKVNYISVRNNQITTLDVSHFPLDQLKWLKLGMNPLECNCSLLWLWKLEQEYNTRSTENNNTELALDLEDIRCSGPEPLNAVLLLDSSESQVGCSVDWIAAVTGVTFTCVIISIILLLFYCKPLRKAKMERPSLDNPTCSNGSALYEEPTVDKYIIGTPYMHEYQTLAPWEQYTKDCSDVYRQFDNNIISRPHIVYV